MKKIYLFGNPSFEQDSLPIKLSPKLKTALPQFKFYHLDPTENFPEEEHLILLDTILDIEKVKILTEKDLEKIQLSPNYSLHDFDLSMQLKIAKKLDKIKKLTLIGLPANGEEKKIIKEIKKILSTLS